MVPGINYSDFINNTVRVGVKVFSVVATLRTSIRLFAMRNGKTETAPV